VKSINTLKSRFLNLGSEVQVLSGAPFYRQIAVDGCALRWILVQLGDAFRAPERDFAKEDRPWLPRGYRFKKTSPKRTKSLSACSGCVRLNGRRVAWAAPSGAPTFGAAAEAFLDRQQRKAVWKGPKLCLRWRNALMGLPMGFRDLPADKIDAKAVYTVLEPMWDTTPETARRLRGRIEAVLDYAREPDDSQPNPAAWSGWLRMKLGAPAKIKLDRRTGQRIPAGHHPALLWQKLRAMGSTAAVALEFLILTAARTSEVTGMPFEEVGDLDALKPVWTVPKERMKMSRDHQVPLSARAVEILREQRARRSTSGFGPHPYVFAGDRPRSPLSNMAMVLRRLKIDVTVHGMRAAFRSWCADTGVAFELAEAALAHSSSSIVAAYQRSALTERRLPVMEAWVRYCAGEAASGEVVVALRVAQ
jgi:integrase